MVPRSAQQRRNRLALKVRPLLIDARIKEFTLGTAHDVTDRLFVVRRAFRVNDSLPQESPSAPHWQWQRGGWLLVDRVTGHISPINLPEFDAFYSAASWYRDYAAYCGVAEDGKKVYAVVAQISRRKPVLKKLLEGESVTVPETKERISRFRLPHARMATRAHPRHLRVHRSSQTNICHPWPHRRFSN